MHKSIVRSLVMISAVCILSALAIPGQAQNAMRGRKYSKADVDSSIRRVENASDRFARSFDSALDRSRLDGTKREDKLNERAKDLENDLDSLRRDFDRTDRYQDTRSQVSRVMTTAEGINTVVRNRKLGPATERQWAEVRRELNSLANYYNLRQLK